MGILGLNILIYSIMNVGVKICEMCNGEFEVNLNNKRSYNKRFCCLSCSSKFNGLKNRGRKHTNKWKKDMSIRNSGENNPFYNKKHTKESKNKMSESSKWDETKYKYCNLKENEKEIFDGIMISDGSLSKSRISARLTLGFKYKETLIRINNDLDSICFSEPYLYEWIDKRTKNKYRNYYNKSLYYHDLLKEYDRWYNNGKKIIPSDFILTKLSCYWWYVCDGFYDKNVYLCTDSYDNNYILPIIDKFKMFGFKCNITSRNRIRFFKKDSQNFLNWISNDIQIQKEYLYKWYKK